MDSKERPNSPEKGQPDPFNKTMGPPTNPATKQTQDSQEVAEVQVLSTQPEHDTPESSEPGDAVTRIITEPELLTSNDRGDDVMEEGHEQDRDANDPDVDLPPMDWDDFDARYAKAIADANAEEDKIFDEFDHLVSTFGTWCNTSIVHDIERSAKRVKTRQRYVQLAEEKLEDRRKKYMQAVEAFKSVMNMLGDFD